MNVRLLDVSDCPVGSMLATGPSAVWPGESRVWRASAGRDCPAPLVVFSEGSGEMRTRKPSIRRGQLLAVLVAVGAGWGGSAAAWGDTLIDTTGCLTNGSAQVSGTPNNANEVGNILVAPTGYLKTFAANLAADGNQPVTLALYNANTSGPVGAALWTQPATINSTGSTSMYALQTFTVDQPLITGQTYAFALISGAPAANTWWTNGQPGTTSGACYPGPVG